MLYRRTSLLSSVVVLVTIVAFVVVMVIPVSALAQTSTGTNDEEIARRFEQVMVMKSRGDFDQAIDELNAMIKDYEGSEQVLRLAYSYLVATYHEQRDTDGARRVATQALERFPDITAQDIITVPPSVDDYYDTLRHEMFGALHIVEPKGALVFLNNDSVGESETPLRLGLVRAGEYDLMLTKSGYHDYTERIAIMPDDNLVKTIQMRRARDKKWWLIRVGVVCAAVATGWLVYELLKDDPPDDLGAPPVPPD
jgi:hypothetical protein